MCTRPLSAAVVGSLAAVAATLTLATPASAHAAPSYEWVPITAPAGCQGAVLRAVSPNGERRAFTCATWTGADGVAHRHMAMTTHGAQVTALPAPTSPATTEATPTHLSNTGWVTGTGTITPGGPTDHPRINLVWTPDGRVRTYSGGGGDVSYRFTAVTDAGDALYNEYFAASPWHTSIIASDGTSTTPPTPEGWSQMRLYDATPDGQYVGVTVARQEHTHQWRPVTWRPGEDARGLQLAAGYQQGSVSLVSPNGAYMVGSVWGKGVNGTMLPRREAYFSATQPATLLPATPELARWEAKAVANDGTVVGRDDERGVTVYTPGAEDHHALWPLVTNPPAEYATATATDVVGHDAAGRVYLNLLEPGDNTHLLMGYVQRR